MRQTITWNSTFWPSQVPLRARSVSLHHLRQRIQAKMWLWSAQSRIPTSCRCRGTKTATFSLWIAFRCLEIHVTPSASTRIRIVFTWVGNLISLLYILTAGYNTKAFYASLMRRSLHWPLKTLENTRVKSTLDQASRWRRNPIFKSPDQLAFPKKPKRAFQLLKVRGPRWNVKPKDSLNQKSLGDARMTNCFHAASMQSKSCHPRRIK